MAKLVHFDEVRKNNIRTFFIFLIFFGLVLLVGAFVGLYMGSLVTGMVFTFFIGFLYALIAYSSGRNMLLRLTGAKKVTKREYPHLFHSLEGLALAAGIPTPEGYVIESKSLNAFATGRNPDEGVVVVTTGLLEKLNREELEGVVAHEIAHIKNYDIRTMLMAAVLVGVLASLSHMLIRMALFSGGGNRDGRATLVFLVVGIVLAILTPFIGEAVKMSLSRKREYAADATAAVLTRNPRGLSNALKKLSGDTSPLEQADAGNSHLFISSPKRKRKWMEKLFSTHPPIDERIRRLEVM